MTNIEINSKEYWNKRFQTDWDERLGREQSRYFAKLAVENLPVWLTNIVQSQNLTICDWGCAEGDGTDVLCHTFSDNHISGVDFSEHAILKAAQSYPKAHFLVEDWVSTHSPELAYDVVFSSNTLEHFHEPHIILQQLLKTARKCVILLLPYREFERHHEHHYTFLGSNLLFSPTEHYVLAHSHVIDTSLDRPCYWPGQQILLIYTRPDFTNENEITLKNITIQDEEYLELIETNKKNKENFDYLINEEKRKYTKIINEEKRKYTKIINEIQSNEELNEKIIQECKDKINTLSNELTKIKASRSWKYISKIQSLRQKIIPNNSVRYKGARLAYKSGTFLSSAIRNLDYTKFKHFIRYSKRHGIKEAFNKTRTYIARADGYQNILGSNIHSVNIHDFAGTQDLIRHLSDKSYRGVFIMGSRCMGWHEVFKQRTHHIADYLMSAGYLVICAMNPIYPRDQTNCIKRESESLFLVNFEDRNIWKQVTELLAVTSRSPLFYHLVGTEPGTTYENINELKDLGFTIVYDYIDEISKEINPSVSDFIISRHENLLSDDSVLLITTADNLYNKALTYRTKNIIKSPNGVRLEDWLLDDNAPIPSEMSAIIAEGKPIVGYYGNFAVWMNYDYIKALSTKRPDINIVMIGHDYDLGKGAFTESKISELPNVHVLPAQNYYNLKYFSKFFDTGIIPFREYELTKSVSPVKMFEYMAQGIPTVASGLQECRNYESCLNAENEDDFVQKVSQALLLKNDVSYIQKLKNDAKNNTWNTRGKIIESAMSELAAQTSGKLLTIVIPTYNMENLLPRCVDSMIAPSQLERLEIIIVNDGSKDESLKIAHDYESRFPSTVKVINKDNGGHGSCINAGIKEATGKYFKIVDADDWLNPLDLTRHMVFLENHDADMIVTNYLRTYDGGRGELVSYNDRLQQIEYSSDEFYRSLMVDNSSISYAHMHSITYKSAVLKDNDITITENAFYVDQEYISYPQKYIKNVIFENIVLYRYYIGRPGQSVDPTVAKKRAPNNYRILQNIIKTYESMPDRSEGSRYIRNIAYHHTWFYLENSDDQKIKVELMQWWRKTDWHLYALLNKNFQII